MPLTNILGLPVGGPQKGGGLLNFLSEPTTILGLNVLNNANRPAEGLLTGIQTNLAFQRQQLLNQLYQQQLSAEIERRQQEQARQQIWMIISTTIILFLIMWD